MDYLPLAVAIACAIFWYRGAQIVMFAAITVYRTLAEGQKGSE